MHGVFSRWEHLVGAEVAQHCHPESFSDGKLVVRTDSTAWATQMRLLAPTALRRLNEELGDGTVTLIDVQGPSGPTWRKGRRSVRDGRGPRDTYGCIRPQPPEPICGGPGRMGSHRHPCAALLATL